MIFRNRFRRLPGKIVDVEEAGTSATRHRIPSGDNVLDAVLTLPSGSPKACVLICHGIGETVEHWRPVQRMLAQNGVCSLVFDYSGYGRSSGRVDAMQFECDAQEAFWFLQRRQPAGRVSVLGYSMGSGVAAAIVSRVPACKLVLCAAFSSFHKAARQSALPAFLTRFLPDIWNNEEALRHARVPVLIVHGAKDRLFPPSIAKDLTLCCAAPCESVVIPEAAHEGPICAPTLAFWGEVIGRL